MGFIKKMGSRGGFYGPLYIKSAQRGRLAYMRGQGVIDGGGSDDLVFHAASYDPDTFELQQELVGVGGETCTHTSTIYSPDYEGVYRAFEEDEPVWEGARVVENFIDNGTPPVSNPGGTLTITDLGNETYEISGGADETQAARYGDTASGTNNTPYIVRCEVRVIILGSKNPQIRLMGGARIDFTNTEWTVMTSSNIKDETHRHLDVIPNTGGTVECRYVQIESAAGRTDTVTPSEFVGDLGKMAYANSNGNSVTDNVVTEAVGTLLDPLPVQVHQDAATNEITYFSPTVAQLDVNGSVTELIPNTPWLGLGTPVLNLQSTTGLRYAYMYVNTALGRNEVLSVWVRMDDLGTPSSELNSLTGGDFTLVIGDVVEELSDSKIIERADNIYQVLGLRVGTESALGKNAGITKRSGHSNRGFQVTGFQFYYDKVIADVEHLGPIFTEGTAVATDETIITHAAANHDNAEGAYTGTIDYAGDDTPVLSLGGVPFLYIEDAPVSGKQLTLSDGTNATSLPITVGKHDFEAHYKRVLGDELIENGDFSNGTTGWSAYSTGSVIDATGDQFNCETTFADKGFYQQIPGLIGGTEYVMRVDVLTVTTDNLRIGLGSGIGNLTSGFIDITTPGHYEYTFTPIGDGDLFLSFSHGTTGNTSIDNVTFREESVAESNMQLKLDGTVSPAVHYDGTMGPTGSGDITIDETGRDFKRLDTSEIV